MNMTKSRVIQLWKKGCTVKHIAKWGENADNPNALRPLGNFKQDLPIVEKIIWDYQKEEKMI
jgi:hypothetical protein